MSVTPRGAGTTARGDGGRDWSAIKHQQAWLDKLVREDELNRSPATPSPRVATPVSKPSHSFQRTKAGLSLARVLQRSQVAAAGSQNQPSQASSRAASREKASLSQRVYLDWLMLEHKHSGMSLQRQVELRALFERCADDPVQLQRHGLHAAALLKASGHGRMLNTPSCASARTPAFRPLCSEL